MVCGISDIIMDAVYHQDGATLV